MSTLNNLEFNDTILYKTFNYHGLLQTITLTKTNSNGEETYFFKSAIIPVNKVPELQGFMYFTLDKEKRKSKFIGVYVNPNYRNQGISSLLISSWINFCLDNGFESLTTNRKQKKPFILHQLKGFEFELDRPKLYDEYNKVIYICQRNDCRKKYLLFKDDGQKQLFLQSKIITSDNYQVLDNLDEKTKVIDQVILSKSYNLQDNEQAYSKSLKICDNYGKIN